MYKVPSEMDSLFDRNVNNLIKLDDILVEATQDKRISQLFRGGRHDNLTVIYLTKFFLTKLREKLA